MFNHKFFKYVPRGLSWSLVFSCALLAQVLSDSGRSYGQDDSGATGEMDQWGDFSFDSSGDDNGGVSESSEPVDNEVIPEGVGSIGGQVFDAKNADVISGVTVTLEWPDDNALEMANEIPQQQTVVSDERGVFGFADVPSGRYTLMFFKNGYQIVKIKNVKVYPDETQRADAAMQRKEVGFDDDVFDMGEFAVEYESLSSTQDLLADLKQQSVGNIDYLTAADFAKFGGSDLSSVIKRLPGVTVVEGQFAVVRGLGDRYNSTLVNGLPIASPDPVRQGLQLDLFPTSIIESVVTQKQFLPNLPSNSSGAAFELETKQYTEETIAYIKAGMRFNSNAMDTYLKSPSSSSQDTFANGAGSRTGAPPSDSSDAILDWLGNAPSTLAIEADAPMGLSFGAGVSGTIDLKNGDQIGIVFSSSYNSDFETQLGYQQDQFAQNSSLRYRRIGRRWILTGSEGSLYYNKLERTDFMYDLTASDADVDIGILGGVGYIFDTETENHIDFTFLSSLGGTDYVKRLDNSRLPSGYSGDVGPGTGSTDMTIANNFVGRGGDNSLTFNQDTISYEQRELYAYELTGTHEFAGFDGFSMDWGAVFSRTASNTPYETVTSYVKNVYTGEYSYYGDDTMANSPDFMTATWREIDEDQFGARMDFDYEWEDPYSDWLSGLLETGIYWSQAHRNTNQVDTTVSITSSSAQIYGDTAQDLEDNIYRSASVQGFNSYSYAVNERKTLEGYIGVGFNITEAVNITGGGRFGNLSLTAKGNGALNARATVPNVLAANVSGNSNYRNADLIGYNTSGMTDDAAKSYIENTVTSGGDINEGYFLPAIAVNVDVTDDIVLKGGFSETLAQPSFREMSPYFSRDLGTGDLLLGNPLLQTSRVQSFDVGFEYRPWEGGLLGVGAFYKTIEDPIEQISLYANDSNTNFLTFFNNPNTARLRGVELQFATNLAPISDELEDLTFGTNFAYIDASVAYPENVLLTYFSRSGGSRPIEQSPFTGVDENGNITIRNTPNDRRLFDQPEYIVNAYMSYNNPDWGSTLTLSVYAQSDVLTAVGSGSSMTVDQYTMPYYSLDLTYQQVLFDGMILSFSVTNLTDSDRGIIYDETMIEVEHPRQEYTVGQTYTISLTYTF